LLRISIASVQHSMLPCASLTFRLVSSNGITSQRLNRCRRQKLFCVRCWSAGTRTNNAWLKHL
jgi:hypothetical protein